MKAICWVQCKLTMRSPMRRRSCTCAPAAIVVATGAYETQFLFANNDLPGIMLSTAVLRLLHQHAIVPGKRAVLIGEPDRCSQLAVDLEAAGIEVVASLPITPSLAPAEKIMFRAVVNRNSYL
jgi:sarcosine oxidase subunit alpha